MRRSPPERGESIAGCSSARRPNSVALRRRGEGGKSFRVRIRGPGMTIIVELRQIVDARNEPQGLTNLRDGPVILSSDRRMRVARRNAIRWRAPQLNANRE